MRRPDAGTGILILVYLGKLEAKEYFAHSR